RCVSGVAVWYASPCPSRKNSPTTLALSGISSTITTLADASNSVSLYLHDHRLFILRRTLEPARCSAQRSRDRTAADLPPEAPAGLPATPRQLYHLGRQRSRSGGASPGSAPRAWRACVAARAAATPRRHNTADSAAA